MAEDVLALLPKWIVPVEPAGVVLEDHAVIVQGDRIAAVLPTGQARRDWPEAEQVMLDGQVLIPGLINCHTHSAMSLFRGMADDLPLMDWLQNHIWPAEQKWADQTFVTEGTELAIAEMLRGGTTCFNDLYFFPDAIAETAVRAGIRAVVGLPIINLPTAWAGSEAECFDRGLEVAEALAGEPLVSAAFAPHAPYTVTDEGFRRIAALAGERDMRIHLHLHETAGEVEGSMTEHGMRPLARMDKLGIVGPRLLAVHMTQLTGEEMDLLAERGCHVFHCPESNLKLASGFCPVAELERRGVNVSVGTDGAASNNDLDMIGEIRTAALLAKGVARDPEAVPAARALAMGTINPARALGLEDRIGSIEVGKQADLASIRLDGLETAPVHNVISHLVYCASRNLVEHVWVAGRPVLENGRLCNLDEQSIKQQSSRWLDRLAEAR